MSNSAAMSGITIRPARTDLDLVEIRRLFRIYADWLKVDLCFQGFEDELAGLPGKYSEPSGGLWLGWVGDSAVACVGMRPLEQGDCEMKRLWVEPEFRGTGLGRKLALLSIDAACEAGHRRMVLDTFEWLTKAVALYRDLGFQEIEAYYRNPESNVCYMAKDL